MCLVIPSGSKELIAEEDIKCYKILEVKSFLWFTYYQTPFLGKSIKLGKTYKSRLETDTYGLNNKVERGLHSMANIGNCEMVIEQLNIYHYTYGKLIIIDCTIPKGSTYYKGSFCNLPAYASNTIIYK